MSSKSRVVSTSGPRQGRLVDSSDPRRPEAVTPFPGAKQSAAGLLNIPLYLSFIFTGCTLILRNRVYAPLALVFAIASIFTSDTIFSETGMGPAQACTFSLLGLSTVYTPLILDLTPKTAAVS